MEITALISLSPSILRKTIRVSGLFTIERLVDQGWKRELSCQTEFKAFLNARSRCMASGNTYRVINSDLDVICLITLDGCKRQYGAR